MTDKPELDAEQSECDHFPLSARGQQGNQEIFCPKCGLVFRGAMTDKPELDALEARLRAMYVSHGDDDCEGTPHPTAHSAANAIKALRAELADHEEVHADKRRLVRELDVILNGEEGAAKQASLCDIVGQVASVQRKSSAPLFMEIDALRLSLEAARGERDDWKAASDRNMAAVIEIGAQLSAANAKLAGAEKDAARYRHLIEHKAGWLAPRAPTSDIFKYTRKDGVKLSMKDCLDKGLDDSIAALVEGGAK